MKPSYKQYVLRKSLAWLSEVAKLAATLLIITAFLTYALFQFTGVNPFEGR